jgi:hypothetical protein
MIVEKQERVQCPACGKSLAVPLPALGRKGKCPACKAIISIEAPAKPSSTSAPSSAPPPPPPPPRTEKRVAAEELAQQPTHREEVGQDKRRMLAAVSMAPDKYALVEPYLMDYEQPVAIAVQRQFPFSIFTDIVLLSSHRVLMFKRFFSKIDMFDVNYVDFQDVTVKQGFFTSALTVCSDDHRSCTITRLITDQALHVYRLCQKIETKARIARRQFQLEENRSKTTQMQINNLVAPSQPPALSGDQRPVAQLPYHEHSRIGDEESDPFRLGE